LGLCFLPTSTEDFIRDQAARALPPPDGGGDLDASLIVTHAVRWLLRVPRPHDFDYHAFLSALRAHTASPPITTGPVLASNADTYEGIWKNTDGMPLTTAPEGWRPKMLEQLEGLVARAEGLDFAGIRGLEEEAGLRHSACTPYPGRAFDVLPIALWHFCLRWRTPSECLARAACCGGDVPMVCSVVGALLGALHGTAWVPKACYETLTNGIHGREYAVRVGRLLHSTYAE